MQKQIEKIIENDYLSSSRAALSWGVVADEMAHDRQCNLGIGRIDCVCR